MREWLERALNEQAPHQAACQKPQTLKLAPLECKLVALATRLDELHATNAAQAQRIGELTAQLEEERNRRTGEAPAE
jgi:hypothetical protein